MHVVGIDASERGSGPPLRRVSRRRLAACLRRPWVYRTAVCLQLTSTPIGRTDVHDGPSIIAPSADAKRGTRYYAVYVAGHSFGRKKLGARLRELREAARISRLAAAQIIMKRTADAIGHYETGARLIQPLERDVLARHYAQALAELGPQVLVKLGLESSGAILDELEELYTLASKPGEFTTFGLPENVVTYLELERAAAEVRTFQNLIIPGLLQVDSYMRRLFQLGKVPASDVDQRARARLKRQERLRPTKDAPDPLRLTAVIGEEGLLRCAREPEGGHAQLTHLAEVASLENVEVRVMDLDGMHAGMDGSFTRLDFNDEVVEPLAYLETTSGTQLLTDVAATVRDLDALFDELCGQALDSTKSLALITQLASYKMSRRRSGNDTQ